MTNKELAAQCLIEAAELLNDDSNNILNESLSGKDIFNICALALIFIGGTVIRVQDYRKNKRIEKEAEKYKKEREKYKQEQEERTKEYVEIISKKEIKIRSKEDLMKSIFSDIKSIILFMKKNKKYMDKIKNIVNEICKEDEYEKYHGLICKEFEGLNAIEIINGTQSICSGLSFVIDDIESIIKKKYAQPIKDFNLKISTGDGDEGCFYME